MKYNFLDKDTKFIEVKENPAILSAIQEVAKAKGIDFEPGVSITLQEIAQVLEVDEKDLLLIVNEKNGTIKEFWQAYPEMLLEQQIDLRPKWLDKNEILNLDVRESLSKGVDPFGMIMQNIRTLNGKILHIINTFETTPLYSVLGKQGFEYYSKEENGVWHIYFFKK
jgi:hypothetical protein